MLWNVENNKYCLYFHINMDKQDVFYVGIGDKKRPHSKKSRSIFWRNITEKHKYNIVVIEENLTWDDACKKEIYWIKRIGRRDLEEGTLVNLTDGGEGNSNFSKETRDKISKAKTGKIVNNLIKDLSGKVFGKLTVIRRGENFGRKTAWICDCECGSKSIRVRGEHLNQKRVQSCGCLLHDKLNHKSNKAVMQIEKETGKILSVFNSIENAFIKTDVTVSTIQHFLKGNSKYGGGYDWKRIDFSEYQKFFEISNSEKHKLKPYILRK